MTTDMLLFDMEIYELCNITCLQNVREIHEDSGIENSTWSWWDVLAHRTLSVQACQLDFDLETLIKVGANPHRRYVHWPPHKIYNIYCLHTIVKNMLKYINIIKKQCVVGVGDCF